MVVNSSWVWLIVVVLESGLILFAGWTSLRSSVGYLVCWRMFLRVCGCLLCGDLVCLVSMVICYLCLRG